MLLTELIGEEKVASMGLNALWIGEESMEQQLIEECGELIKAICKYNRSIGIGQPTPVTPEEAYKNLIGEIGDVLICIDSLGLIKGIDEEELREVMIKAIDKVAERRKMTVRNNNPIKICKSCELYDKEEEMCLANRVKTGEHWTCGRMLR